MRRRFAVGLMAPTVEGVAVACIEESDEEHETKATSRRHRGTQISPPFLSRDTCSSLCKSFSLANIVAPWPVGDCDCLLVTAAGHDVTVVLPGRCVTALSVGWRVSTKVSKTGEVISKQG